MKKSLFQYAVIFHDYEKTENGKIYKDSKLIVEPKFILAATEKEVVFKATREVPDEYSSTPDDIQILVRNF